MRSFPVHGQSSDGLPSSPRLAAYAAGHPSATITALGNGRLLDGATLGLFCSTRCPGELILHISELAQALRDTGIAVVGGFHTPVEKECLRLLLRQRQAVVICPARSIEGMRIPPAWRAPLGEGRLLVLSPFPAGEPRVTARLAQARNEFAVALADAVLVLHASSGGQTEQLARQAVAAGTPVFTIASPANTDLVRLGARIERPAGVRDALAILHGGSATDR